ncbi:MAG: hypothetical protein HUN05_12205 [Desulfobacter sp.]|nr:MAG: hypothetical protein HUN05_12205 [Desulfobacter sp.]
MAVYLLFWFLSYGVIYAGTCKNCIYYGKSCPIPLEGSCVQHFFRPGRAGFGIQSLLWAVIAYVIRFCLPIFIIIRDQMIITGMGYLGILTLFWIIHLGFTGCPNCINDQCPLNFDYKKGSGK